MTCDSIYNCEKEVAECVYERTKDNLMEAVEEDTYNEDLGDKISDAFDDYITSELIEEEMQDYCYRVESRGEEDDVVADYGIDEALAEYPDCRSASTLMYSILSDHADRGNIRTMVYDMFTTDATKEYIKGCATEVKHKLCEIHECSKCPAMLPDVECTIDRLLRVMRNGQD